MVEAACIEVTRPDTKQDLERLVRPVARRVHNLILPLAEMHGPDLPGGTAIDTADALLIDVARTDGTWMGDGPRPSMQDFLDQAAQNLASAALALDSAATDSNRLTAAGRSLLKEAWPLATSLATAFRNCQLTGDSSELVALQETPQPSEVSAPAPRPSATAETKEHHVLDAIALQASILLDVVDSAGRTCDLKEIHGALDAARTLTATIGSLADGMTGETKRGNQYDWHNATPN